MAVVFSRTDITGSLDQYFDLKRELERLFRHRVDFVCAASVRNTVFRREFDETKKLI